MIDVLPNLLLFQQVKQLAVYLRDTARISASASSQEVDLRRLAAELGYRVIRVFQDPPPRHTRAREPRKGMAALMHAVRAGSIDAVAVWSLPVVAGSTTTLGKFLTDLSDAGVRLLVHDRDPQRALAAGEALLAAGSHLADLGRADRRRRTLDGQAHAVARGQHIGRPRVTHDRVEKVRRALAEGVGIRAAARIAGIAPASALRIARDGRSIGSGAPIATAAKTIRCGS